MQELGFGILATKGTAAHLEAAGIPCSVVLKIQKGWRCACSTSSCTTVLS